MNLDLQPIPMLAVGLELIVFLGVLIISAIFNWLSKRGESDWTKETSPRPQTPPVHPQAPPRIPTPPRATDWEQELRRMLEGKPPPTHTAPPAIPRQQTPPPIPRPARTTPPPIPATHTASSPAIQRPEMYRAHCEHCGGHIEFARNMTGESIRCPHCFRQTTLHPFGETSVERMQHQPDLRSYKEAAAAFQRASSPTSVSSRFQQSSRHIPSTSSTDRRSRTAEIEEVLTLLRNPRTARQAIVASVIMSPPKALEE